MIVRNLQTLLMEGLTSVDFVLLNLTRARIAMSLFEILYTLS